METPVATYEFDVNESEGTAVCRYQNVMGMTFSALVKLSDYSDAEAAKAAATAIAMTNEENYKKMMGGNNE
ncbi:hypothetical protein RZP54_17970 [Raoultella ornithinolytica]|nr:MULTISPECIES: hypothetical protein [Klebsiella/Raoultella group]MDV0590849.1 hypothetical protein [Raoultella ornithinolytica]MEB5726054.1 hypothetical protein [Raoultella ornithinolytica]RVS21171.1 hypothetical protein EOL18_04245 [Raoultella ornithinolytica]UDC53411.1 hypothetical protein LGM24_18000 [Klebsiella quasipneumoniae subsp. quasipneumoniae]VGP26651.1 hypothetical protein SB02110_03312 [Klebsiella quasipneumoniae subsp. quasipneumoniae]